MPRREFSRWRYLALCTPLLGIAVLLPRCGEDSPQTSYVQTNLVSDVGGRAAITDPQLVNPWGIARSSSGPFWVNDAGSGVSTVYDGNGNPVPGHSPLVVNVPTALRASESSEPTGLVFNPSNDFVIERAGVTGPSTLIFATARGAIAGWNQTVDSTNAIRMVDGSGVESSYTGLAMVSNASGNFLLAVDFHDARVDVFDRTFRPTSLSGSFEDSNLPAGFAPFGIQSIGSTVYVTYAQQGADRLEQVAGAGLGYVNAFDANGNFVRRIASQGSLNAPWGIAQSPGDFGKFSNSLLIGNLGDGRISAFDPVSGEFQGQLTDMDGNPIEIEGLWGISFGNGQNAGPTNKLFFASGPDDQTHGLLGTLEAQ